MLATYNIIYLDSISLQVYILAIACVRLNSGPFS